MLRRYSIHLAADVSRDSATGLNFLAVSSNIGDSAKKVAAHFGTRMKDNDGGF